LSAIPSEPHRWPSRPGPTERLGAAACRRGETNGSCGPGVRRGSAPQSDTIAWAASRLFRTVQPVRRSLTHMRSIGSAWAAGPC